MMTNRKQKNTRAAAGDMDMQADNGAEDSVSQVSQSNELHEDEAAVWKDKYIRLLADLKNTKNRLARNAVREVEVEKEALLLDVLPVADNLDLALIHTAGENDSAGILQGIELIRNILNKFFAKYDVQEIDAWSKPFDPTIHDAIGVVQNPKFLPNTVVRVEKKGYLYRDKLLRPALVLVASKEDNQRS
jgi:molecular chaperone GrpE